MTIVCDYSYLWEPKGGPWVLIVSPDVDRLPVIFNSDTGSALLIEDDGVYASVVLRMRAEGVSELDEVPPPKR